MTVPEEYPFTRYLRAKKSVDDRALNRGVWQRLAQSLAPATPEAPLHVLEVGAGIGTMLTRILEWGLLAYAEYTALDVQPENIAHAGKYLQEWGEEHAYETETISANEIRLTGSGRQISAKLIAEDLFHFLKVRGGAQAWDLMVAHAFLDLVDLPTTLPRLLALLRDGGVFYFSLNYDGVTILEPVVDPPLEARILSLYHESMDARKTAGRPSGDSRTGRRLFKGLRDAGAQVLAAGSSDWVVFPDWKGYPADEAFFLHFIIDTIHQELKDHPRLDPQRFDSWVKKRHAQIERGELFYIAHQLDYVGTT